MPTSFYRTIPILTSSSAEAIPEGMPTQRFPRAVID
jgi:hypothetical protein